MFGFCYGGGLTSCNPIMCFEGWFTTACWWWVLIHILGCCLRASLFWKVVVVVTVMVNFDGF